MSSRWLTYKIWGLEFPCAERSLRGDEAVFCLTRLWRLIRIEYPVTTGTGLGN